MVHPDHRAKGLGKRLVQDALTHMAEVGIPEAVVQVLPVLPAGKP